MKYKYAGEDSPSGWTKSTLGIPLDPIDNLGSLRRFELDPPSAVLSFGIGSAIEPMIELQDYLYP